MTKHGLLLSCLGAVLLALSTHLGIVSGFVGVVVWAGLWWRLANLAGWLLLSGGLFLQYLGVRRTHGTTTLTREIETLVSLLERKGLLMPGERVEVFTRMQRP